jgi:rhodanese-related sulfurtransferase
MPSSSSVVSPEWLRECDLKSGAVRVIDCRQPAEYESAHIPTATSFYVYKATNLKVQ